MGLFQLPPVNLVFVFFLCFDELVYCDKAPCIDRIHYNAKIFFISLCIRQSINFFILQFHSFNKVFFELYIIIAGIYQRINIITNVLIQVKNIITHLV